VQVIKALLTAITCPTCVVREQSLLLAVRTVYHIFLVSRNAINKNTAKATLRQMLTYVFQRMEAASAAATAARPGRAGGIDWPCETKSRKTQSRATQHEIAGPESGLEMLTDY
jgi:hypothetical protein